MRVSWQTSTEALSFPVGDSPLSRLQSGKPPQVSEKTKPAERVMKWHLLATDLIDGEGQLCRCGLTDVGGAALRRVALHDGEDL